MEIRKYKVEAYETKYICECGEVMEFTGMALATYPMQYEYRCTKCGKGERTTDISNIIYERVEAESHEEIIERLTETIDQKDMIIFGKDEEIEELKTELKKFTKPKMITTICGVSTDDLPKLPISELKEGIRNWRSLEDDKIKIYFMDEKVLITRQGVNGRVGMEAEWGDYERIVRVISSLKNKGEKDD